MTQKQQSEYTKMELSEALKQAMQHKSFSKITVSELVSACHINRKTFYYHFENIYALLVWMLEQEALEVVHRLDLIQEHEQAIRFALNYIEQNEVMLRNIYHSVGRDALRQFLYNDFIGISEKLVGQIVELLGVTVSEDYRRFLSGFCTEAIAGTTISTLIYPDLRQQDTLILYLTVTLKSTLVSSLREMNQSGGTAAPSCCDHRKA